MNYFVFAFFVLLIISIGVLSGKQRHETRRKLLSVHFYAFDLKDQGAGQGAENSRYLFSWIG